MEDRNEPCVSCAQCTDKIPPAQIVLLVVWIALVNIWVRHHVETDVIDLFVANGVVLIVGLLRKIGDYSQIGKAQFEWNSRIISIVAQKKYLGILYVALFLFALFFSSVWTTSNATWSKPNDRGRLHTLDTTGGVAHQLVPTWPVGRRIEVRALGMRRQLRVYPFVRLNLDKTFRMPTIVIRLPPASFPILGNARLVVLRNGDQIHSAPTVYERSFEITGSFRLGPKNDVGCRAEVPPIRQDASEEERLAWNKPVPLFSDQVQVEYRDVFVFELVLPNTNKTKAKSSEIRIEQECHYVMLMKSS